MSSPERRPCPKCQTLNYVTDDICVSCGHDLPPGGPQPEAPVAEEREKTPSVALDAILTAEIPAEPTGRPLSQRMAFGLGVTLGIVELLGALALVGVSGGLVGEAAESSDMWGIFPLAGAAFVGVIALGLGVLGAGLLASSIGMWRGSSRARIGVAWIAALNGLLGLGACYLIVCPMIAQGAAPGGAIACLVVGLAWTLACVVCWGSARWADV